MPLDSQTKGLNGSLGMAHVEGTKDKGLTPTPNAPYHHQPNPTIWQLGEHELVLIAA